MHRNKPNGANMKDFNGSEFPGGFKANQAWTYTYDAQGKRRNYSYEDAAETPGSKQGFTKDTFQSDPRARYQYTSAAAAGPSKSYTSHSSYSTSAGYAGGSYGGSNADTDKDAVMKLIIGTFAIISVISLVSAGVNLKNQDVRRLTGTTSGGSSAGMSGGNLLSAASDYRIEAMKAVPMGQSSNYSNMIAKQAVEGTSLNNTKGGTRSDEEFKKQFQTKKPAKPIGWEDIKKENEIREKHLKENKKEII